VVPAGGSLSEAHAISALAALAQPTRLAIFRLLVRHEPVGVTAGVIAETIGAPHNTLHRRPPGGLQPSGDRWHLGLSANNQRRRAVYRSFVFHVDEVDEACSALKSEGLRPGFEESATIVDGATREMESPRAKIGTSGLRASPGARMRVPRRRPDRTLATPKKVGRSENVFRLARYRVCRLLLAGDFCADTNSLAVAEKELYSSIFENPAHIPKGSLLRR